MNAEELPRSRRVLLLIDFINPMDFPGAEDLAEAAVEAARATSALKARLREAGVPAIYANDNYGGWQSDFQSLVERCAASRGASGEMARLLRPERGDLTVLKPRHSAFYASPLELLLAEMETHELIICGLAADMCVQLTAADAFLREYRVWVPSDCTAAETAKAKTTALDYMADVLKCEVHASTAS